MKLNYILAAGLLAATAMSLTARDSKYTRRGAGPMYWMAYEECFVTDRALSEARYKMNVDWVADNFKEYGFDMICTDGFLYKMCRAMVGTMVYASYGKLRPEDIPALLEKGDRRLTGPTMPPQGLYLNRVWYDGAAGEMMSKD